MNKKRKKLKKKNPIAKLLSSPMLRNKIIKNRTTTKLFDTKTFTENLESEYEKLFNDFKGKK